jgi:hypothetical protein
MLRAIFLASCIPVILVPAAERRQFRPATFAGFTMGKATVTAFVTRFGKPLDEVKDASNAHWLYYRDIGPVPGEVEVIASSKTGIIEILTIYPENVSVASAKDQFGPTYRIVRYSFDHCLAAGDGIPLYESEAGELVGIIVFD